MNPGQDTFPLHYTFPLQVKETEKRKEKNKHGWLMRRQMTATNHVLQKAKTNQKTARAHHGDEISMLTNPFSLTAVFRHESLSRGLKNQGELQKGSKGWKGEGEGSVGAATVRRWGARRWRWCRPTKKPWTRTAPLLAVVTPGPLKNKTKQSHTRPLSPWVQSQITWPQISITLHSVRHNTHLYHPAFSQT